MLQEDQDVLLRVGAQTAAIGGVSGGCEGASRTVAGVLVST